MTTNTQQGGSITAEERARLERIVRTFEEERALGVQHPDDGYSLLMRAWREESKARAAAEAERDEARERERDAVELVVHAHALCGDIANARPDTRIYDLQHSLTQDWIGVAAGLLRGNPLADLATRWRVDKAEARATAAEAELATERSARERAEEAHSRAAKNEVALAARAEQAEAAAAVMRRQLDNAREAINELDHRGDYRDEVEDIDRALATDAGPALLAEREALRAEVERLKTTSEVHRLRDLSARVAELEALVRHAIDVLDEDVDEAWLRDAHAALSGTAPAEGTCFECGRAAHAPDCDVLRGIKPAEGTGRPYSPGGIGPYDNCANGVGSDEGAPVEDDEDDEGTGRCPHGVLVGDVVWCADCEPERKPGRVEGTGRCPGFGPGECDGTCALTEEEREAIGASGTGPAKGGAWEERARRAEEKLRTIYGLAQEACGLTEADAGHIESITAIANPAENENDDPNDDRCDCESPRRGPGAYGDDTCVRCSGWIASDEGVERG